MASEHDAYLRGLSSEQLQALMLEAETRAVDESEQVSKLLYTELKRILHRSHDITDGALPHWSAITPTRRTKFTRNWLKAQRRITALGVRLPINRMNEFIISLLDAEPKLRCDFAHITELLENIDLLFRRQFPYPDSPELIKIIVESILNLNENIALIKVKDQE